MGNGETRLILCPASEACRVLARHSFISQYYAGGTHIEVVEQSVEYAGADGEENPNVLTLDVCGGEYTEMAQITACPKINDPSRPNQQMHMDHDGTIGPSAALHLVLGVSDDLVVLVPKGDSRALVADTTKR